MNNTQQAGETAFVEKHMKVIREKMKESMIEQQITRNREYLRASMQHFLDGGNVSGQFYLSLMEMMSPAILSPTPAPDAVEAKVAEKARLYVEDFCKPIYYHSENCHKAALLSYLAGHAEGLKATVEAKSAGVWVNELRRLLESESVKALLRFAYKNPMRSGMDDFEGKEYIDLYHFDTSVMQPSTPNT